MNKIMSKLFWLLLPVLVTNILLTNLGLIGINLDLQVGPFIHSETIGRMLHPFNCH